MRLARASMMMRCLLLLAASASSALPLHGQVRFMKGAGYADIELGARFYLKEPPAAALGRLQEYRDLSSGLYLPTLNSWYQSDDSRYRVDLKARNVGREDQRYQLRMADLGRYSLELQRDQAPHVFSTTARFLDTSPERGVFVLSAVRPVEADYNTAPFTEIGTRWTTNRLTFRLAPSATWSAVAQYTRTAKSGDRPFGMLIASPREILEPIEHTIHQLRLTPAVQRQNWQAQLIYDFSAFENDLAAVVADNAQRTTDDPTAGPARGRVSLAPDNQAHTLAFRGGARLPFNSRLNATVSYGLRRQRQDFLPYTINSAINTTSLLTLPEHLDGDIRTTMLNVSGTTRVVPGVSLGMRYRFFDVDDRTPSLTLNGRVVNDRTLRTGEMSSHRYPHSRQSVTADARWRVHPVLALQFAFGWDRWERDEHVREAAQTAERAPRAVLDFTPTSWFALRTSYVRATRRTDGYYAVADAQLPLLRKHDQADRDRDRVDVRADLALPASVGLGLNYALGENDYPDSRYGRATDRNRAVGVDLSWTFRDRITAYASVMEEKFDLQQRSRYRAPSLDDASFDWIANSDDLVKTASIGISAVVMPRKLDVGVNWDRSLVYARMNADNPGTPTGGTESQRTSATAVDFPEIRYTMNPASAYIRYRLTDTWSASARYSYDRFEQTDFRVDGLQPAATLSSIFLGNDPQNYRAQLLSLTVRYSPRLTAGPRAF